jgi:hypothetical protein
MLKKFIDKLLCCHEWTIFRETEIYSGDTLSGLPYKIKRTLICKKCGKIKQIIDKC